MVHRPSLEGDIAPQGCANALLCVGGRSPLLKDHTVQPLSDFFKLSSHMLKECILPSAPFCIEPLKSTEPIKNPALNNKIKSKNLISIG